MYCKHPRHMWQCLCGGVCPAPHWPHMAIPSWDNYVTSPGSVSDFCSNCWLSAEAVVFWQRLRYTSLSGCCSDIACDRLQTCSLGMDTYMDTLQIHSGLWWDHYKHLSDRLFWWVPEQPVTESLATESTACLGGHEFPSLEHITDSGHPCAKLFWAKWCPVWALRS